MRNQDNNTLRTLLRGFTNYNAFYLPVQLSVWESSCCLRCAQLLHTIFVNILLKKEHYFWRFGEYKLDFILHYKLRFIKLYYARSKDKDVSTQDFLRDCKPRYKV